MNLPLLSIAGYGNYAAQLVLPALKASGSAGAIADIILPFPTLYANGQDSTGDNASSITLPKLSITGYTGARAAAPLPSLQVAASGRVTAVAKAQVALPSLAVNAAGSIGSVAQAAITLPMVTGAGYFGGVLSVTLGDVTVAATGSIGNVGAARVTLPLFEMVAAGTVNAVNGAAITLPALQATRSGGAALQIPAFILTAIGSAVVTATYEAYAVNLNHSGDNPVDEMTRYTNYPFTHIVRYQNSYFGVAANGLYLLEGTTDHATPTPAAIPWKLKTHVTDFDSPMLKTAVSVYVGGRLGQTETFTLYAGETSGTAYVYTNPRGATAQNYRQKLGRGVKARYFAVGLEGDGAAEIDNLEFEVNTTTRRI